MPTKISPLPALAREGAGILLTYILFLDTIIVSEDFKIKEIL